MRTNSILLSVAVVLGASSAAIAQQQPKQEAYVVPNAPKEQPLNTETPELQQIEAAIKPYIEKARDSYPQAKARFLDGLPPKHILFITTRLRDTAKRFEQVFIAVREIREGQISGVVANEIRFISGYRKGDPYSFPESELIDWTITKPEGAEEGNFVGNFLETFQLTHAGEVKFRINQPATPARMRQRIEKAAIDYAADAPISRIVFYDISFPGDEQEFAALDGNAVMLFTSLSQNRKELPLERVYVLYEGKKIELKLLETVLAEMDSTNTPSTKVFGKFRADSLYLLPMSLYVKNADLHVDFRETKGIFKVGTLGTPLPDELNRLFSLKPSGAGPSQSALEAFIKSVYPGFFQN